MPDFDPADFNLRLTLLEQKFELRMKPLENGFENLVEEIKMKHKKLDELLEFKHKGLGALSLIALLFTSGVIASIGAISHWFRGG